MPQELTHQERAELEQLLQEVFAEREVQTLLTVFERLRLPGGSLEVGQELRNLQAQVMEGQRSLQAALEHLAQAQTRTEERVGKLEAAMERLAQAQARTEEHLSELRQAQTRTEERVGGLEAAMERLAQAQARTEGRMESFEVAMERLAQAQAGTERAMQDLARQVGGLSETVGGDIEDIAYIVLHDVLNRNTRHWHTRGPELKLRTQPTKGPSGP